MCTRNLRESEGEYNVRYLYEYTCSCKWRQKNSTIAHVHYGDVRDAPANRVHAQYICKYTLRYYIVVIFGGRTRPGVVGEGCVTSDVFILRGRAGGDGGIFDFFEIFFGGKFR